MDGSRNDQNLLFKATGHFLDRIGVFFWENSKSDYQLTSWALLEAKFYGDLKYGVNLAIR